MLYKILLSLNYPSYNAETYTKSLEKLVISNWRKVNESNQIWVSEIIAYDLLSAKIRIERDLNNFFKDAGLSELSYAFQLSLGDVTTGKLKQLNERK